MEVIAPIGALLGVLLGTWLSRRSAEETRLRDLRLERYTKLLQNIDAGNAAIDGVLRAFANVSSFETRAEWDAHLEEEGQELNRAANDVRETTSELSLFASPRVSEATVNVLSAWRDVMQALPGGSEQAPVPPPPTAVAGPEAPGTPALREIQTAAHTAQSASEPGPAQGWPDPAALQAARDYEAARVHVQNGLVQLRALLVMRLRADIGVDRASALRRTLFAVRAWTSKAGRRLLPRRGASSA